MRVAVLFGLALLATWPARATPPPGYREGILTAKDLTRELRRGILPATPTAEDFPPGASRHRPVPSNAPKADLDIPFATGSATLDPAASAQLAALGQALTGAALKGDRFLIEGHTDTVGTRAANQLLSERRARQVAAFLIAHYDIGPDRLRTQGVGQDNPAILTPDQTAEPRNRRVRLVNLGAG